MADVGGASGDPGSPTTWKKGGELSEGGRYAFPVRHTMELLSGEKRLPKAWVQGQKQYPWRALEANQERLAEGHMTGLRTLLHRGQNRK